jgi:hypothetical protein
MNGITIHWLTLAAAAVVVSSCSKKAETPDTSPPEAYAPVAQPIPATSNSNSLPLLTLPPAEDIDAVLAQLTREVRKWIVRHQRPPQNFEEFAASAPVQIPAAPVGKRFALNKQMRVIVVNR